MRASCRVLRRAAHTRPAHGRRPADPGRVHRAANLCGVPAIVVVGAQGGDEGKGKATDQLGGYVDYVVKFNGGNNAGHTVVIGEETYALHLLPSGILSPGCTPVIGNGVVVDLAVLFQEIDDLEARGFSCERLRVSADAHVIASYNRTLDRVAERFLGNRKIGTT